MSDDKSPLKQSNKPTLTAVTKLSFLERSPLEKPSPLKKPALRLQSPERRLSPRRIVVPTLIPGQRSPQRSVSPPSRIASVLGSPSRINSHGIREVHTTNTISPVRGARSPDRKHFNMSSGTTMSSVTSSAKRVVAPPKQQPPPRLNYGQMSAGVKLVKQVPSKMIAGKRRLQPVQTTYKKTPKAHYSSSANSTLNSDTSTTTTTLMNTSDSSLKKKDPAMNLMESFKFAHKSILKKPDTSDTASPSLITENDLGRNNDVTTKINTLKNKNGAIKRSALMLEDPEIVQPRKRRMVVFDERIPGNDNNNDNDNDDTDGDGSEKSSKTLAKSKDTELDIFKDENNRKEIGELSGTMTMLKKIMEQQASIIERQELILSRIESLEQRFEDHQEG